MENIIFLFEEKVLNGTLRFLDLPQTIRTALQQKTDEGEDVNVTQTDAFTLTTEWSGKILEYVFSGFSVQVFYGNEYDTFDFSGMPNGFCVETMQTSLPLSPFLYVSKAADTLHLKLLAIRKG